MPSLSMIGTRESVPRFDKIGTDFEEFVTFKGRIVSAIGLLGGDKDDPVWVHNGNIQEDNVLAEGAVNPCADLDSFIRSIHGLRSEIRSALPKGYALECKPWHWYQREELMSFGSNALRFGCSPEINAWTEEDLYAPSPYTELRTAGGHVHFSYNSPQPRISLDICKILDYTLGLWSVVYDTLDRDHCGAGVRRKLYGKAGSCRIKEYGGEYRALSNFWCKDNRLITEVFNRTKWSVENVDKLSRLCTIVSGADVQEIINEYDVRAAQRALLDVDLMMQTCMEG